MLTRRLAIALLLPLTAALAASGCTRDIKNELAVVDVRTGWYDMGPQPGGENKLVQSVSLKIRNLSTEPISGVELNAVFRNLGEEAVINEHYVRAISSSAPLAGGATTGEIVLRAQNGYTSQASRLQMLQHSQFVDGHVTILARHARSGWIQMEEVVIDRQLLTE